MIPFPAYLFVFHRPVQSLLGPSRDERLPVSILAVTTTSGNQSAVTASGRSVPKKELVSVMEIVFEKDLLKVASVLGQADEMREELRQFERWSTKGGHMKFGAGAGHDDLVMALGLACWWAWENRRHVLSGPEVKPLD